MSTFVYLDELSLRLSELPMFPYFDVAHYIVSVMALRQQPGSLEVSRVSPVACWFSAMLYCFGGTVLAGIMLAEPPVAPLSNGLGILLASIVWYLIFYCPMDVVYSYATVLPLRLLLSGMKEVTRTWKVLDGVTLAQAKYKDSLLVMIAIGLAKGAGGSLISNFEQLVRGVWRPETNELLKMSYPTKITLIGAVLFSLQQTAYLPVQKQHLMMFYTISIVVIKVRMIVMEDNDSPFAPIEQMLYRAFFKNQFCCSEARQEYNGRRETRSLSCGSRSNGSCAQRKTVSSRRRSRSRERREDLEYEDDENSKKAN